MVTMVTWGFGVSDEADTATTRILITAPLTLHEPKHTYPGHIMKTVHLLNVVVSILTST